MTIKSVIDPDCLAKITTLHHGSHDEGSDEMCVMEAVAFVTHKKWSDHPPCVCPVLGAFMRTWNDGLSNDDERTALLLPFIPRLINTRGTKALEQRRATMAADWLIRTHTVAWLRLAKLDKQADLLAALPEITDFAQCPSLMPALTAVCNDAAAARAATWAAAWAAAQDATWAAAQGAAQEAAQEAAWAAAQDATWAAAQDATWAAAWADAWADASKTKTELQRSAAQLVERMIGLSDQAEAA